MGNVGNKPAMYRSDAGSAQQWVIATFPLATSDKAYTTKDGKHVPEQTEWHNIVVYNRLAEVVEKYVNKGDKVYLEGRIRSRKYTDQSGVERIITEICVEKMELLGVVQRSNPAADQPLPPPSLMDQMP